MLLKATFEVLFYAPWHSVLNREEFPLNVFIEFSNRNICHYSKRAQTWHSATSCVRDQDVTTPPVRHTNSVKFLLNLGKTPMSHVEEQWIWDYSWSELSSTFRSILFFSSRNSILRRIFCWLMKNLWWESDGKANEKTPINKFQLKTYLFKFLYQNMGNLNRYIRPQIQKKISIIPGSLVRRFIHCTTEPIDVTCKRYLHNIKQ